MRDLILNKKIETDRKIFIEVEGYIDTKSAPDFGDFIIKIHDENPTKKLIIDFANVEMITSAGIRQLLLFEKKNYNYELINLKTEVSTVLDLTGMSDILKLEDKVLSINVDNCKVLGKGFSSCVYKIDNDRIAKVYYKVKNIDQPIRERMIAKQAFVKGVPTEICYCLCEAKGMPGLIYELVDAKTLLSVFAEDITNVDKYIKDYVKLVKEMHTFNGDGITGIYNEKERIGECIEVVNEKLSPEYKEKLNKVYDAVEDKNILLHGDAHPANVMLTDRGMLFIDLSEMSVGDELFDLMYLYRTFMLFSLISTDGYALNRQQEEYLWNAFSNEYYKDVEESEKQRQLYIIRVLAIVSIVARFIKRRENADTLEMFINMLKKELDDINSYLN